MSYISGVAAPPTLTNTIKAAEADYNAGDKAMSAMRLALAIPTPFIDEGNCRTLHVATGLIEDGLLTPIELLSLASFDEGECGVFSKYSPDQPRVPAGDSNGGEWTRENSGTPSAGERSAQMTDGCTEEWQWARNFCIELLTSPNPSRSLTGGHKTVEGCAKGFVSQRCGGNKVV